MLSFMFVAPARMQFGRELASWPDTLSILHLGDDADEPMLVLRLKNLGFYLFESNLDGTCW
jgi:hypothetical protein